MRTCGIDGCDRKHHGRGWCDLHWQRWKAHGDPTVVLHPRRDGCSVAGCERTHRARGLCGLHYRRWLTHGDPLVEVPQGGIAGWGGERRKDPVARFWNFVEKTDSCWLWVGGIQPKELYGNFWLDGTTVRAHRYAYELLVGPIPEGLTLDHLCRVRHCVNPAHLEPVTQAENNRRASARTHCKWGHEFTPENTYIHPKRGTRICKACAKRRSAKFRK